MLRVCEKLRAVDAKRKRLGLARTETDYLRALLDATENMDRYAEVEVLKSLGDVNLEKGQLDKNPERFDRAMVLYRTALLRYNDADVGDSLEHRYHYAEKLRLGKRSTASSSYEPLTNAKRMSSLAKVAEVFLHLEQRLTVDGNKESLLIEYTKLVVEGVVNDDNVLEAEAIKSLGDVYLKRGIETKDTTCLTKATALYNTALVRCEGSQGRASLIHRLLYTARMRQERKADGDKRHVTSSFFRSYEEYLSTGDRALADGKLDEAEQNFASALRLIHGCCDACIRCLGRIPYASLIATILLAAGIAVFCGSFYTAVIQTRTLFSFDFRSVTVNFFNLTEALKWSAVGITAFMGVYAFILLLIGFLATGASKEKKYCGFGTGLGSRITGFQLFNLYIVALVGALVVTISLVHYLMCLSANYAHLKDSGKIYKYEETKYREEQELHNIVTNSKEKLNY
uniref:Uncharacterized protein n=1 Tax=Branchiostoma floridae TaxID=7739 RepID=C3YS99_BRAFL|eukprot:XP_002600992.1 hypothetical protein BRAFLDRAFT_96968 [Branchiostoma floridae]